VPDEKKIPTTKKEMEEEDRRDKLSPGERAEEDAAIYAAKPEKEVKQAFKLPGPLVYTPPLDSEWAIEERARLGKAKAARATFAAQENAQKRSDALSAAAMRGFNVRAIAAGRQPNWNGVYCTKSSLPTDKCVKLKYPMKEIVCNAKIQECHFKSPQTGKWEVAEPLIECSNGQSDCDAGVTKVETERWLVINKMEKQKEWSEAVSKAKEDRKLQDKKDKWMLDKVESARNYARAEITERGLKVAITQNRPNGIYQPLPKLDTVDKLGVARSRTMKMRQQLGAVDQLLQKLGILSTGCDDPTKRCNKMCSDPGRIGQRKDPDGSICRAKCTEDVQMCMIKKIKLAAKAAAEFELRKNATNQTNATKVSNKKS